MKVVRIGPGRPRKFGRPSRAVTLTLPDDVIATLEAIDKDLGQAVVRVALPLTAEVYAYAPAELFRYGDSAVIVIQRIPALEQIPGVTLVPLPDGRALISLDESLSLSDLELKLRDTLDEDRDLPTSSERAALTTIVDILKRARHTKGLRVVRRSIIVLQSTDHRRRIVGR
jgi:hypothetical protein